MSGWRRSSISRRKAAASRGEVGWVMPSRHTVVMGARLGARRGLRRNHRPAYIWSDDGQEIRHGNEEDLMVFHFDNDGRRVRISSTTSEQPRRVADRVASAYFNAPCTYVDDGATVERAQIENLIAAITDP